MSYSKIQISVETLYKRKVFTFIGHYMKIRNIAFIAVLIGWIALAVYYAVSYTHLTLPTNSLV